jgi:hypothetical protein
VPSKVSPHPELPGAVVVALTNGGEAIIDAADLPLVAPTSWRRNRDGYAVSRKGNKLWLLHRYLWSLRGRENTAVNGERLDCRLSNLRPATHAENMRNRKLHKNNTSGIKGVSKRNGRFLAHIRQDGKAKYLGSFPTIEQAAEAYATAARRLHGEFARVA